MNKGMVKGIGGYFLGLSGISLLLIFFHGIIPQRFPGYHVSKGIELIALFSFLFLLLHVVTVSVSRGKPEWFVQMFMVQTTLKMLFLLSLFLLLSRFFPAENVSITGLFFLAYLLYTLHDLFWLLLLVRKNTEG
jgi:hypothetical protein